MQLRGTLASLTFGSSRCFDQEVTGAVGDS
jgi:hypothetical protein